MNGVKPGHRGGIPVFVMLPLDTVNSEGVFKYATSAWFAKSLSLLGNSGACGVAVDLWWGAVERGPGMYTWNGYKQLFEAVKSTGLKLQVVFSFHACGYNVGDTAKVPLPAWVLRCGDNDPDLFFTDRPRGGAPGQRNREYLSVWADEAPAVLAGRSPMQCYEDFMASFRDTFSEDLGSIVEEVVARAGPCGELRFPSYVEANGWRFPGVGEFQCYDRRALASLAEAARDIGHAEWGCGGPHDTGDYNSVPEDTGFYHHDGSWDSPYGRFFLGWYSGSLMKHGDRLMAAARRVFRPQEKQQELQQEQQQVAAARTAEAEKGSGSSSEASVDTAVSMLPPAGRQSTLTQPLPAGQLLDQGLRHGGAAAQGEDGDREGLPLALVLRGGGCDGGLGHAEGPGGPLSLVLDLAAAEGGGGGAVARVGAGEYAGGGYLACSACGGRRQATPAGATSLLGDRLALLAKSTVCALSGEVEQSGSSMSGVVEGDGLMLTAGGLSRRSSSRNLSSGRVSTDVPVQHLTPSGDLVFYQSSGSRHLPLGAIMSERGLDGSSGFVSPEEDDAMALTTLAAAEGGRRNSGERRLLEGREGEEDEEEEAGGASAAHPQDGGHSCVCVAARGRGAGGACSVAASTPRAVGPRAVGSASEPDLRQHARLGSEEEEGVRPHVHQRDGGRGAGRGQRLELTLKIAGVQ